MNFARIYYYFYYYYCVRKYPFIFCLDIYYIMCANH